MIFKIGDKVILRNCSTHYNRKKGVIKSFGSNSNGEITYYIQLPEEPTPRQFHNGFVFHDIKFNPKDMIL